jgi:hypothetical protein
MITRMNDEDAIKAKEQLDAVLDRAAANVGIAFAPDLFDEFRQRQWLTAETFGALGTGLFMCRLPSYRRHFAFESWDVPDGGFEVGRSNP